jgi:hypothetical protein
MVAEEKRGLRVAAPSFFEYAPGGAAGPTTLMYGLIGECDDHGG